VVAIRNLPQFFFGDLFEPFCFRVRSTEGACSVAGGFGDQKACAACRFLFICPNPDRTHEPAQAIGRRIGWFIVRTTSLDFSIVFAQGAFLMSRDVIIETRNLTKVYRDFWGRPKVQALKALDLQVYRGEIFGLLGPNGSGKTTTIKLLLGLLFPTEGDALIFNEPTNKVAKNERIGYLPEESYLYKFLNAEETLHFYGRLFKLSAAERTKRVGHLIDMVGLNAAKHRQLREYSKGMQRRIGLAQALINNPELILLDEPTSGLDPIGTAEIKELIRDLRTQGKTIVLSGHLLADMQDICDRIAILHRGELKELGKVTDLLTVQDVTQIKTRELPELALQEIRQVIARHGGELLAVDHPTTTLEELFLRIVRESDLHPGRRRVAEAAPTKADALAQSPSKS